MLKTGKKLDQQLHLMIQIRGEEKKKAAAAPAVPNRAL